MSSTESRSPIFVRVKCVRVFLCEHINVRRERQAEAKKDRERARERERASDREGERERESEKILEGEKSERQMVTER